MYDVIVVGAGPVGMTTALVLAESGLQVCVLEAEDRLGGDSRASTWHPPTLEMLHCLGMATEMVKRGLQVRKYQYRSRQEGLIAEMDMALLADDTSFPFRLQLEQGDFTRVMAERLRSKGVPVRFGARVESVISSPGSVRVNVQHGSSVDAKYVVGADGASSAVRRSLGAQFGGMTYEEKFLTVTSDFPFHDVLTDFSSVNYVADERDWLVLLRVPTMWRVLVPLYGDLDPSEDEARRSISSKLESIAPGAGGVDRFHWTVYRVHQRVADHFYADRVGLVGDAAHINSPIGGMGMNSGIHDAFDVAMAVVDAIAEGEDRPLRLAAERRRSFAVEFVQKATVANTRRIMMTGDSVDRLAELREIAAHPGRMYSYVRGSSMLDASLELTGRVLERYGAMHV